MSGGEELRASEPENAPEEDGAAQPNENRTPMPSEWGRHEGILYESRPISNYAREQIRKGESLNFGESGASVVGKKGFNWREELSEPAQILYPWLFREMGHPSILNRLATEHGFDLEGVLAELWESDVIERHPTDPATIRVVRRRLK